MKLPGFLKEDDGSLKGKILRSGFWVGFADAFLALLGLARNIILARLLAPEIFGLMGLCLVVIRGIELFTETGFAAALIQRREEIDEAKKTAFSLIVIRGVVLSLFLAVFAPYIASFYENATISEYLRALSLGFIINALGNINLVSLEKKLDFKRIAFLKQSSSLIDFCLTVMLAYFFRNIWALIIGKIFSSFVYTLLSYWLIPGKPEFALNKKIAFELIRYGKYITGLTIVLFIASEIDNLFIGKILGFEALGFYVIAYFLANLPATKISKVISKIMFPAYSSVQQDIELLNSLYLKTIQFCSSLSIPAAAGIGVLAPDIIGVIYGEKWHPAVQPLQILCIFGGCRAIMSINGYLFNAVGKPYVTFSLGFLRLSLILVSIVPLTKLYGITGTALSVTVSAAIQLVASKIVIRHVLSISLIEILKKMFYPIFSSFVMAALLAALKSIFAISTIWTLTIYVALGASVYFALSYRYVIEMLGHLRK